MRNTILTGNRVAIWDFAIITPIGTMTPPTSMDPLHGTGTTRGIRPGTIVGDTILDSGGILR